MAYRRGELLCTTRPHMRPNIGRPRKKKREWNRAMFPLPHSSPALAELTSGLFAGSEICAGVFRGDSGRFLACLVSVRPLVSGCGVSMNSGCGVPIGERMPPTLLLPAQEASATPNATTPTVLAMTLILYTNKRNQTSVGQRPGRARILALFKARVYLIGRCWATLPPVRSQGRPAFSLGKTSPVLPGR
jgi:hypothetical protein